MISVENLLWGNPDFKNSEYTISLSDNHSILIQKDKNEIFVTNNRGGEITVNRYITDNEQNIFIEPALPNLPIILNSKHDISILPSNKLTAYVEIPFTIKILYGSQNKKTDLCEIEQKLLSKSFFGNSESGEFAYFLDSPLHENISDYQNLSAHIYCPLSLSNKSSETLKFEKMIFRAPYLSIYQQENILIGSQVSITFKGHEQLNQILYKKSPPGTNDNMNLLAHPRLKEDKNLLKKSFYFIKNLYTG